MEKNVDCAIDGFIMCVFWLVYTRITRVKILSNTGQVY